MFKLCLFDLDDTLVRTVDLKEIRESGKNVDTAPYRKKVSAAYSSQGGREIYKVGLLRNIRKEFPDLKIGVFTRSPRAYAETVLDIAYPDFEWDVLVAYEDVKRTKPHGLGIHQAMDSFQLERLDHVLMVGDQDSDIRSAYNAGVAVVLDKTAWAAKYTYDNWNSLAHVPDAIIRRPEEILAVLRNVSAFQPDLERLLSGAQSDGDTRRYDRVGKFIPKAVANDTTSYPVYCCGRSFAGYDSISEREKWHVLSQSIHDNKESETFPDEWVKSICGFIRTKYQGLAIFGNLVVSVVPHRPGRTPRLENLLNQMKAYMAENPFPGSARISFEPELLAYKDGVRSNHKLHLSASERFQNVRDHLYVSKPEAVRPRKMVLVIDDVCTTGASLIYAGKFLKDAGSGEVTRLAVSMNIGNVLYD